jgi:glycosyltransferase involved in cell wall biosynthesis
MNPRKFGIVIPCFNEAGNLSRLIAECEQIAGNGVFQFVLINNGSTDSSIELFSQIMHPDILVVNLKHNKGYGGGILEGLHLLKTDFVGWIHADSQVDLKESLNQAQEQSFEFFKGIRTGRTTIERVFSVGMSLFCSTLFKTRLFEINAQPTIMTRVLFESWSNPPEDFSLDLYSLLVAKRAKVKIIRYKFAFEDRSHGHSSWNFGIKSRLKMILRTLRYAWSLYRGGVT